MNTYGPLARTRAGPPLRSRLDRLGDPHYDERLMTEHLISYDLARGLHVMAVIAWMAGMLMLPHFYAGISALSHGEPGEQMLLRMARSIRAIILAPFMVLAWAFGIFLFFAYFAPDWNSPSDRLSEVPSWFWVKVALVLALSAYHGMLVADGRRLAAGERRRSVGFWRIMSVIPFIIATAIVLLATLEP